MGWQSDSNNKLLNLNHLNDFRPTEESVAIKKLSIRGKGADNNTNIYVSINEKSRKEIFDELKEEKSDIKKLIRVMGILELGYIEFSSNNIDEINLILDWVHRIYPFDSHTRQEIMDLSMRAHCNCLLLAKQDEFDKALVVAKAASQVVVLGDYYQQQYLNDPKNVKNLNNAIKVYQSIPPNHGDFILINRKIAELCDKHIAILQAPKLLEEKKKDNALSLDEEEVSSSAELAEQPLDVWEKSLLSALININTRTSQEQVRLGMLIDKMAGNLGPFGGSPLAKDGKMSTNSDFIRALLEENIALKKEKSALVKMQALSAYSVFNAESKATGPKNIP